MTEKRPEQLLEEDIKRAFQAIGRWLLNHAQRYLTASLLKAIVIGFVGVGIAAYSLPVTAAVACGFAVFACATYGVYGRKIAEDEYGKRRWTWIAAKRLNQQNLRLEQRLDAAVFDLLGKTVDRGAGGAAHSSPELRAAIAVRRHAAFGASRQQLAGIGQQQQRPAPPGPDLKRPRCQNEGAQGRNRRS